MSGGETDEVPRHWVCIYPAYLNSKRTLAEGRKLSKEKGVENPTTQEVLDVIKSAGLPARAERKMYSRDGARDWTYNGRVRVELKDADGQLRNPDFPSRNSLLLHAARTIPKLKSRQHKSNAPDQSASQKPPKKNKKNR